MSNAETLPDQVVCRSGGLPGPECDQRGRAPVEIITARDVPLGGPRAMTVHRTLPRPPALPHRTVVLRRPLRPR